MAEVSLKEVEKELDDLSIRILELMNDNISCKMNIERAVRSGCMDFAKARYIMGSTTSVSALKIPSEDFSATTTVVRPAEEKPVFELKREPPQKSTSINQDPLKWFGVLVPTNLRQGQAWFTKAIDLSVQSANISADISTSIDKYNKLLSDKSSLKNQVEE